MAKGIPRSNMGLITKSSDKTSTNPVRFNSNALTGKAVPFERPFACDIGLVVTNPDQPRKIFREEDLASLAASLDKHGLKQPIGVQQQDNGEYLLVWGERRWRAAKSLGWPTITAVLTVGDPLEVALVENVQRVDLSPFEQSDALHGLKERHGYTDEALAGIVGKDRSMISKLLRLQSLPEVIREEYAEHEPTLRFLLTLTRAASEASALAMWDQWKSSSAAGEPDVSGEPSRSEKVGADGERPSRKPADNSPEMALSALPQRVFRVLSRAQETIGAMVEKPRPLTDSDWERLTKMRSTIDTLLEQRKAERT
ncbi:ParB/RepB/Spo0J family partition protein [Azospirillum canadense]|uniref:ParB/RepB/Spo0J family partition protein n=1 Tax=Azospirillum canadense TaxID=403962 RepID=UPI0022268469|nr:ParB/RepB/Spo0J family partition protein [Azospirillum canadense]MCW2239509.1 ParB family chromosome partitioning protein [Azospirillum canadense]